MKTEPAEIRALFIEACELDVLALKPGNVGLHGAGGEMCADDFIRSAHACAPAICRRDASLGERILGAVTATRAVVEHNTNLGIVLLCAPLVHAALGRDGGGDSRTAVAAVLERATVADAVLAYRAIRAARPGGMGRVDEADLADEPTVDLRAAMGLARSRDLVAAQYVDGYALVFDEVVPCLLEFQAKWGYAAWSAAGAYLALLSRYPDSLVARKHGAVKAQELSAEAAPLFESLAAADAPERLKPRLLEFDRRLKRSGFNPGTTADLVIAGLFIAGLEGNVLSGKKTAFKKGFLNRALRLLTNNSKEKIMAIDKVLVGEALVNDNDPSGTMAEIAHIDLLIGPRGSAAESAFCHGLVNNKDGFTSLLAVIAPNLPCKPNTMMFNKVTIKGATQAVQMFGPAQSSVAKAVQDCVAEGTIPQSEADNLYICVGVFIHWEAKSDQAIYENNYKATKMAIENAINGKPTVAEATAQRDSAEHPFKGF